MRLSSNLCHGCWYTDELEGIGVVYADVIHLLRAAEIPVAVTQTGGMCMALTFPWGAGYFLLTDAEDTLSWERDDSQGWALGLYDQDGESLWDELDCAAVGDGIAVECGVLTIPIKSAETALALAMQGIRLAGSFR